MQVSTLQPASSGPGLATLPEDSQKPLQSRRKAAANGANSASENNYGVQLLLSPSAHPLTHLSQAVGALAGRLYAAVPQPLQAAGTKGAVAAGHHAAQVTHSKLLSANDALLQPILDAGRLRRQG
jgi:hypothetical protein